MTTARTAPSIEMRRPNDLHASDRNPRTHSARQIAKIARSIERFGFTGPVLINNADVIVAGHGRVAAAKKLGLDAIPTICLSHLSESELRAYTIADNKLALEAGWDQEMLAIEFEALIDLGFDVELTGFSVAEIDLTIDAAIDANPVGTDKREDRTPEVEARQVSQAGDIWRLGRHRLICGDARDPSVYDRLMGEATADLVISDPPYNIPIDGNVCGKGSVRHPEFVMAAGEMSSGQFTTFLTESLSAMFAKCRSAAIAYIFMDWRHMRELLAAGDAVDARFMNLCVWNKTNGGLGTFYRSKHELVFVFKVGEGEHTNNFGLGETGRYRTNVWDYAGISSPTATRSKELAMHPTVKPTQMIADAIKDCSRRGDVVLDGFGGSGTTLIAAEATGRVARLIELDPRYCDVIIRRYQEYTGTTAVRDHDGVSFHEVEGSLLAGDAA